MTAMLPHRSPDEPEAGPGPFGPVARLGSFATELAELPIGPRPAFRAELRTRLLQEAGRPVTTAPARTTLDRTVESGGRSPGASTRRRGGAARRASAVGLVVALSGGGIAAAAAGHALPGEPLYPAKRLGQSVRLALSPSSGAEPSLRLVSSRITDIERVVARDPQATDTRRWRAVDDSLADVGRLLVGMTTDRPTAALRTSLTADRARLVQLAPAVPAAQRTTVRQVLDTLDGLLSAAPPLAPGPAALPLGLLAAPVVSPSEALAAGWPLDLSAPAPRSQPVVPVGSNRAGAGRTATSAGTAPPPASVVPVPGPVDLRLRRPVPSSAGHTGDPTSGRTTASTGSSDSSADGSSGASAVGAVVVRTAGGSRGTSAPTTSARGTVGRTPDDVDDVGSALSDATDVLPKLGLPDGTRPTTSRR